MKFAKLARSVLNRPVIRKEATIAINNADNDIEPGLREWNSAVPYKDVPGPKPIPFLGNTWRFIPHIGDFEIEHVDKVSLRLYHRYGNVVKMSGLLGRPDMVFLFDANEIERVFRQEDHMPLRPSMPSLNYYKHVYRKDFFGDIGGVIAVHGEKWQTFRTRVNQIMMQPRIAKMYIKPIENTAMQLCDRIANIRNGNNDVPDNFLNELHKWSLESIANIALDVRLDCFQENSNFTETQELIDAVNTFFINVPILELKIPFWRLWNTPTFQQYISALETIRKISMKHVNIALDNLKNVEENNEMSVLQRVLMLENDPKVAAILALDLFLVGIDTTSNAVASILYQLATHEDIQDILFEEVVRHLPDIYCTVDNNKLEQMTYLKACIKETMRMYPVVIGNGRCTTKDCVIGGYQIPKGVQIIFQHYVISNMDHYFPRSSEFLPERWLKACPHNSTANDISRNHHPFASLPFGFGKRMCLGRRFADLEIQIVVATILRRYKISYRHKPLDYHVHPMYTPNGPLKLTFESRI